MPNMLLGALAVIGIKRAALLPESKQLQACLTKMLHHPNV